MVADARLQPRWMLEAFDRVVRSDFAEMVVIAAGPGSGRAAPPLWSLYRRADRALFGADLSEPQEISKVLCRSFLEDPDPDLLPFDLDVVFALGEVDDRRLDGVARYGVWRFCFGAGHGDAEAFAGWHEVADGEPATASGIKVRLARGAPPRLAYQSWSRTYPFSVARNRAQLLRKTAEFAWRALRELHRSGSGWLEQCKLIREEGTSGKAPGHGDLIKGLPAIAGRIAQRGLEKALCVDQWFLALRFGGSDARAVPADLDGYTKIMPPRDRTWADPFALEKNGRHFVFFEELPFAAGKAHISMIEVERSGRCSPPVRVLERDYHLSYPFLVEQDGQLYMIPETAQHRSLEVYRCVDFPLRWRLEKTLIDGAQLVDATFHRGADRWWMFANAAARGSSAFDDELHLFYADELLGQWRAHPRNPIKSDARCARPAGQLYWRNGALYRPAQICVPRYGAGLSLNRVLRLTPHDYAERQIERVLLDSKQGLLGIHTINRAGELTVVDAFTRRRRI